MGNNIPFFILWKVEKRLLLTFNMIVVARITIKSPTMNTTTSPSVLGHITKPYCYVLLRMFSHPTTCGAAVSSIWIVLHILGQAATPVLDPAQWECYDIVWLEMLLCCDVQCVVIVFFVCLWPECVRKEDKKSGRVQTLSVGRSIHVMYP